MSSIPAEETGNCLQGSAAQAGWCIMPAEVVQGWRNSSSPLVRTNSPIFHYVSAIAPEKSPNWAEGEKGTDVAWDIETGDECDPTPDGAPPTCRPFRQKDVGSCPEPGQSFTWSVDCQTHIGLQLAGSDSNRAAGRLEIRFNNGTVDAWGTICQAGFTDTAATVACRRMGLGDSGRALGNAFFGEGSGQIAYTNMMCSGDEARLEDCGPSRETATCQHRDDVGVECYTAGVEGSITPRLAAGPNSTAGRLEVQIGSTVGTVCSDGFTGAAAAVVCRSMGLSGGRAVTDRSFGPGPGRPILLDDVNCNGTESSLGQCEFKTTSDCSNEEDVGVVCDPAVVAPPPAPSPRPPPPPPPTGVAVPKTKSSVGMIAGIAAGVAAAVLLAGGTFFYLRRRRRSRSSELPVTASSSHGKPAPGGSPSDSSASFFAQGAGGTAHLDSFVLPGLPTAEVGAGSDLSAFPTRPPGGPPKSAVSLPESSEASIPASRSVTALAASDDPLMAYLIKSQMSAASGSQASGQRSPMSARPSGGVDVQPWTVAWRDITILGSVGEGSFGRVYRGTWQHLDIAAKVLLGAGCGGVGGISTPAEARSALSLAAPYLDKLQAEASLLASVRHPHIVNFYGICREPPCIITEYCPRGSLFSVLSAAKQDARLAAALTWPRRLSMLLDAALGMLHLHSRKPAAIIHRDLKSPNLLVDEGWRVKVTDFGLSRVLEDTATDGSAVAMNPRWLAPELMLGERASPASDVFSFSVVLHEALTWGLPWGSTSPWHIVGQVMHGGRLPVPARAQLPGSDTPTFTGLDGYIDLMDRCGAQDPAKRPGFDAVVRQLRALLDQATGEPTEDGQ